MGSHIPISHNEKGEKLCGHCKTYKSLDDFHKNKSRVDGYNDTCKRCVSKDKESWDEKKRNKQLGLKFCTQCKQWLDPKEFPPNPYRDSGLHSQCRSCMKKRLGDDFETRLTIKTYCQEGLVTSSKELSRKYYYKYHDRYLERARKFNKTERGLANIARSNHRYRVRSKEVPCTLTVEEWNEILEEQNHKCMVCQRQFSKELPPTRDHIIPVLSGGGMTKDNIAALCKSCNSAKKHRNISYIEVRLLSKVRLASYGIEIDEQGEII